MQLAHFGQWIKTGRFIKFDYGVDNRRHYGQDSPPVYNLANSKAPTYIYSAKGDFLTVVADIAKLRNELPLVMGSYLVPHEKFNHFDFVWSTGAPTLIPDEIVKILRKWETKAMLGQGFGRPRR